MWVVNSNYISSHPMTVTSRYLTVGMSEHLNVPKESSLHPPL